MKTVFLVVGLSGSGKDSIARALETCGFKVLLSYTTRPARYEGENTHIFITPEEADQYRNQMVAYTLFDNHEYFCTRDQLDTCDIYIIDPDGIDYLKEKVKDINFVTIFIHVPFEERVARMKSRGDSVEKILQRIINDTKKFKEVDYDYAVKNRNLDDSIAFVKQILLFELSGKQDIVHSKGMSQKEAVKVLIDAELTKASKKFGAFNSTHEGKAIIEEEIDEMVAEVTQLQSLFVTFWEYIKKNQFNASNIVAKQMYDNVIRIIIETIQVGAMCQRYNYDLEGRKK
jgi:guanylate kinase